MPILFATMPETAGSILGKSGHSPPLCPLDDARQHWLNAAMSLLSLDQLLDLAVCTVRAAGRHALENKMRRKEAVATFDHDVKLVLDMECQRIAEDVILNKCPGHSILGEEGERLNESSVHEWIIDPIDGTVNYTHGLPYWCCSVAVRRCGEFIAGAVFTPEFGDLYTAHIDTAACRNGEPIRPSGTQQLKEAMIFTGLHQRMRGSSAHFDAFSELALKSRKLRITGSAALDICHVAAGTGDAYVEYGLNLWDHAAAGLIARKSGAALKVETCLAEPRTATVLCSTPAIIGPLERIWRRATAS